jgi:hypothetical protein
VRLISALCPSARASCAAAKSILDQFWLRFLLPRGFAVSFPPAFHPHNSSLKYFPPSYCNSSPFPILQRSYFCGLIRHLFYSIAVIRVILCCSVSLLQFRYICMFRFEYNSTVYVRRISLNYSYSGLIRIYLFILLDVSYTNATLPSAKW